MFAAQLTNLNEKDDAEFMQCIDDPQIEAADLLKQGVVLTFSDGVTVMLPTSLLLQVRDLPEATYLSPLDEDY